MCNKNVKPQSLDEWLRRHGYKGLKVNSRIIIWDEVTVYKILADYAGCLNPDEIIDSVKAQRVIS